MNLHTTATFWTEESGHREEVAVVERLKQEKKWAFLVEVRLYTTLRKKTGILKKFKTKASKVGAGIESVQSLSELYYHWLFFVMTHFKEFLLICIRLQIGQLISDKGLPLRLSRSGS